MAYREVTMVEIEEATGLQAPDAQELTDELLAAVVAALATDTGRPHGEGWSSATRSSACSLSV